MPFVLVDDDGEEPTDDVGRRRQRAIEALVEATREIAHEYGVCPVCLLCIVAEGVSHDYEGASGLSHLVEETLQ